MYSTLDLAVQAFLTLIYLASTIMVLSTLEKPMAFVSARQGIMNLVTATLIISFLFWFGYQGRTLPHGVGLAMTGATWTAVALALSAMFQSVNRIDKPSKTRSPGRMVMTSLLALIETSAISLMFGLAVAFG